MTSSPGRQSLLFVALTTAAASSISLLGGLGIEAVMDRFLLIVPLVVALPALNSMVGEYAAIIAAHAGDPLERERTMHELAVAIYKSVAVNIIGIIVMSLLLAHLRGFELSTMFISTFIAFISVAIVGIVGLMFGVTIFLDRMLENHHLNPDDVLIPVVTTITDICMLGLITLAAIHLF